MYIENTIIINDNHIAVILDKIKIKQNILEFRLISFTIF